MESFQNLSDDSLSEELSICRALLPKTGSKFLAVPQEQDADHDQERPPVVIAGAVKSGMAGVSHAEAGVSRNPFEAADDDADDDGSSVFQELLRPKYQKNDSRPGMLAKSGDSIRVPGPGLMGDIRFLESKARSRSTRGSVGCLPSTGDEVFGFRLLQELGHGAFARVFLAKQGNLADREVVLKISAIEGTEPQTLAQLQHTHIVPIYSVHEDEAQGLRAVCMPYFGGVNLSAVMKCLRARTKRPTLGTEFVEALEQTQGPLPSTMQLRKASDGNLPAGNCGISETLEGLRRRNYVQTAVWLVSKLAEGLQHAHDRGVLHRDIKPANILVGADGQPLLLDFNVSEDAGCDPAESRVGGTIVYMAPEHLKAMMDRSIHWVRQVDQRSDVYSLGLVLFELLAGDNAFEQTCTYSVPQLQIEAMYLERSRSVPSVRTWRNDIPWSLESIVRKALASSPAQRYQKAADFVEDLQRFLDDQPLKYAPELSHAERVRKWIRRHPRLTTAASITLVSACLLSGVSMALQFTKAQLGQTLGDLTAAETRERAEQFQAGKNEALCLLNTVTDDEAYLQRGVGLAEQTLGLFGVLSDRSWQRSEMLSSLPMSDRLKIADDVRELLLMLADGRTRLQPSNREALTAVLPLIDQAEQITGLEPSKAVWAERSRYLKELGSDSDARQARQRSEKIPASSARDFYLLATAHARKGTREGYRNAIQDLNEALSLDSRHYWSWFERGLCYQDLGETLLAASDFSMCVGLQPKIAWGHFNLGYILDRSGNKPEAIAAYTDTLLQAPDFTPALVNRGVAHLELKEFVEAHADLLQAQTLGRREPTVLAAAAMAMEGLKMHEEADAAFAAVLSQAAGMPPAARHRLQWSYAFAISTRLPQQALQVFEGILAEDPNNVQSLYGAGMFEMQHGTSGRALEMFARTLRVDPGFAPARRYRAILLARTGACEAAVEEINICLERDATSADTLYAAACVTALSAEQLAASELQEQAVHFLERSFENGRQLDDAGRDPDLRCLYQNPRFQNLVPRDDQADPVGPSA